jgi:hypothetical protein
VRRFRAAGVSLQRVRKLEEALRREEPGVARPFAHRLLFTDGASVWGQLDGVDDEPLVMEVVGRRPRPLRLAPSHPDLRQGGALLAPRERPSLGCTANTSRSTRPSSSVSL